MKIKNKILKLATLCALILLACILAGCGRKNKILNKANLSLELGIGNTHFGDESNFPVPSDKAYLDVYSSKIIICDAYESGVIETPLIYNNSATAHPRMKLETSGNKMFIVYCPDISMPSLQFAVTNDGGATWQQSTLSLSSEMDIIDNFVVDFWNQRDGALIASNGTIETFVYITGDSGQTWTKKDSAPPEQDWHDLLEHGTFFSRDIGIISYDFHSKPANEPNVYLTVNGSQSWEPMNIVVPRSVMGAYAKAGKPFYDGEKINIPIDLYGNDNKITQTVYYVSYDLAKNWEFYVDDGGKSEQLRQDEMEKWAAENRYDDLLFAEYDITKFEEFETVELSDTLRIDIYKLETAYKIGPGDWSKFKLNRFMSFDSEMRLCYKDASGWPLLFFIYEGDVFNHTYEFLGSLGETAYKNQDSKNAISKLMADKVTMNEISQLFSPAVEVYSWFTPYALDSVYQGEIYTEINGVMYDMATLTGISTTDDLRKYLGNFFSDSIADGLMNSADDNGDKIFEESEGALHRLRDYTDKYTFDDIRYRLKLSSSSEDSATVTVIIYSDLDGNDVNIKYNCKLSKVDGKWLFDSFEFPILQLNSYYEEQDLKKDKTVSDIADWDNLKFNGDSSVYELIDSIVDGNAERISELLGDGYPELYESLGPLESGSYKITRHTEKGSHIIILSATGEKTYTKYIRYSSGSLTMTDT